MCCGRGFIKRFLPFLLTFAAGLFIASFFVTIAAPFRGLSRGERRNGYIRMLRMENQRLQDRVEELEQVKTVTPCTEAIEPWEDVPPPAPPAPHNPAPPRFVR